MKGKSIGVNAILNVVRQGLYIIFPLITYPYVLKTLGVIGMGKVNYSASIVSYFALFAMLGIPNYVIREGSRKKNNRIEFEKLISEVYTLNIIFTIISYTILLIVTFCVDKFTKYKYLILIQGLSIILTTFGIEWINTIYENYLRITIRSIVTYFISIVLLFLLVRTPDDYYIYAMLTVITNGIICFSNRLYYRKKLKLRIVKRTNLRQHIIPLLILFINSVTITINTNFDTTMLGWMKGDYYVGLYSLPVKIYTALKSMLSAAFIVMLPRLSMYSGNEMITEYKRICTKMWNFVVIMLFPISIGMLVLSKEIIFVLGGDGVRGAENALRALLFALVFSSISGLIMNTMNISLRREKENLHATVVASVVNLVLNLYFIPLLAHTGAAITTFISEITLLAFILFRFKNISKYLDYKNIIKTMLKVITASVIIFVWIFAVKKYTDNILLIFILSIFGSVIAYLGILIILKEENIFEIIRLVKQYKLNNPE